MRVISALLRQHSFIDLAQLIIDKLGSRYAPRASDAHMNAHTDMDRSPDERPADLNGSAEDDYMTVIAPFRIAREELQASEPASPVGQSSRSDTTSPSGAPPAISAIPSPDEPHVAVGLTAPTPEWAVGSAGVSSTHHAESTLYDPTFGAPDLSTTNFGDDEALYLMWDHPAFGAWTAADVNEEGLQQLYPEP